MELRQKSHSNIQVIKYKGTATIITPTKKYAKYLSIIKIAFAKSSIKLIGTFFSFLMNLILNHSTMAIFMLL